MLLPVLNVKILLLMVKILTLRVIFTLRVATMHLISVNIRDDYFNVEDKYVNMQLMRSTNKILISPSEILCADIY